MDLKDTADKLIHGDVKGVLSDVSKQLERTIGLVGVIIISLSAMLGSGLFVLPSLAAGTMNEEAAGAIWLAYLLAATVVLPGAISKAELASAMPVSGGDYIYIERTFGPMIGTISGLGLWASFLLKAAFALIGLTAYMYVITNFLAIELNAMVVSMSVLSLVVIINILGVKKIKAIQAPIVGSSILLLLALSIKVLLTGDADMSVPADAALHVDIWSLGETAALVFVAYAGVTKVAAIAEEIKNPGKNLPNGMYISLATATLLYAGVAYILMATLDGIWWNDVDGHAIKDPIYLFAEHVGGKNIGLLAAVLAILTMASMALAGILASSRYLFAMARDNLLPQAIEDVNAKWETPHWAIILTGALMALVLITLPVKDVAKLASGFQIMVFIIVNICLIVLRGVKKGHEWYQPTYTAPLFPLVQIWGIIGGITLVIIMGEKAFIGAGVAIVIGSITYFSYGKKHAHPRETPFHTFKQEFLNPSPAEHKRREEMFHMADFGGKNHLNIKEFQHALKHLGFEYNSDDTRLIFHKADTNGDGVIDIDEFLESFEKGDEE